MSASTRSISSPTLRTGKRSDLGRLSLGLLAFAARELAATVLVLIGASLLLFLVLKAAPSETTGPLRLDRGAAESQYNAAAPGKAETQGSTIAEYAGWLKNIAVGDFGVSNSIQKGRAASFLIWPAAVDSFKLVFVGVLFSVAIALAAAVWRIARPFSYAGRAATAMLGFFSAIPVFLYVYILISFGNRIIAWGAAGGHWGIPAWFPLPASPALAPWLFAALVLAVGDGGLMDLFARFSGELAHAGSGEHITGARVLGLKVPFEVARAFMPGALSHIARRISFYLGSMVVLEATLGWPGLGYLAWRAAAERDMPVLLGSAIVMAAALRLVLMTCEFIGYAADPRRRGA